MYTPQGFRGIFTMMIPCGNMDRSTHPALHFTGTIINQIHNLFYHLFTCSCIFFLIQLLYRWWFWQQKMFIGVHICVFDQSYLVYPYCKIYSSQEKMYNGIEKVKKGQGRIHHQAFSADAIKKNFWKM